MSVSYKNNVTPIAISYKQAEEFKIRTAKKPKEDDEVQPRWFTRYGAQDAMQFAILHKMGAITWSMEEVRVIYRTVSFTKKQFHEYRNALLDNIDYVRKIMPKHPDRIISLSVAKTWEGKYVRHEP